jgi:hypothetical protein
MRALTAALNVIGKVIVYIRECDVNSLSVSWSPPLLEVCSKRPARCHSEVGRRYGAVAAWSDGPLLHMLKLKING